MGRVTRLRQLTVGQQRSIEVLRHVAELLDSAVVVPGTVYRVGLDPVLGLLPGFGDLVSPVFTVALLWQARRFAIPKVVQLRMILNVAVDTLIGVVPFIGDLFDFAWKANIRNVVLLDRHAFEERPASVGDWAFVTGMVALIVVIGAVPLVLIALLADALTRVF